MVLTSTYHLMKYLLSITYFITSSDLFNFQVTFIWKQAIALLLTFTVLLLVSNAFVINGENRLNRVWVNQINNFPKCFRFVRRKNKHYTKVAYSGKRNNFAMAKWNACRKTWRNESTYERLILYTIQTH